MGSRCGSGSCHLRAVAFAFHSLCALALRLLSPHARPLHSLCAPALRLPSLLVVAGAHIPPVLYLPRDGHSLPDTNIAEDHFDS